MARASRTRAPRDHVLLCDLTCLTRLRAGAWHKPAHQAINPSLCDRAKSWRQHTQDAIQPYAIPSQVRYTENVQ